MRKNHWRTGIWLAVLAAGLATGLGGCRLADPALGEAAQPDRLIGMYITREYLDLFDYEKYLNDHIGQITEGGTLKIGAQRNDDYDGRIYAEYRKKEDGTEGEYVFAGIEGIRFFNPVTPEEENTFDIQSDPEVTDVHLKVTDFGQEIEGTVYCPTDQNACFYGNPVYQTAEGEVYLLAGTGVSGNLTGGASFSQRLEESRTMNQNGEEEKESMSVSVTYCGQDAFARYVIAQMDGQDQKIRETEYPAEDMPDSITVSGDAAYLVCTGYGAGRGRQEQVRRQIVELSEEETSFDLLVMGERGLPVRKSICLYHQSEGK